MANKISILITVLWNIFFHQNNNFAANQPIINQLNGIINKTVIECNWILPQVFNKKINKEKNIEQINQMKYGAITILLIIE